MRRFLHRWVPIFVFCVTAMFCASNHPAVVEAAEKLPKQLVIGYQQFPTAEIVMKDQRWLEQDLGIPIKWVPLSSGVQGLSPLAQGSLDIALLGSSPVAAGVARGVPLQVIWIHDIIGDNEALVAKVASGINKIEDLKGRTVAAPFGSTTHYHLMIALMLNRIKAEDLTVVFMEPRDILAAWQRDEIDAAFIWEPTQSKLIADNGKVLLTSRDLTERGFPVADLAVVRKEFGERYPEVVVKYLMNLNRAVEFCRRKPVEAARAMARQLGMTEQEALHQMRGLILVTAKEQNTGKYFGGTHWNFGIYTLIKETGDFLLKEGVVDSIPPRDAFMEAVNASFLTLAAEQLAR